MSRQQSLSKEVALELISYTERPYKMLSSLVVNSVVSVLFFLGSYWLGSYNPQLLPVAAATILFWTLADISICNQFVFDKHRAMQSLTVNGSLQRFLFVKNISVAIVSVPLTLLFGLLLVAVVGKWSEIVYGMVLAFTLIWGWLGISNTLSVLIPFELLDFKSYAQTRSAWLSYGFLYVLPWILLPVYAIVMGLPFILLGWTKANAASEHRLVSIAVLFALSIIIWLAGLRVANRNLAHPDNRVKRLLQ